VKSGAVLEQPGVNQGMMYRDNPFGTVGFSVADVEEPHPVIGSSDIMAKLQLRA
jgi:hypothetical protein